jgi:hypothetical protein
MDKIDRYLPILLVWSVAIILTTYALKVISDAVL